MQAIFVTAPDRLYNAAMKTGRPSKYPRSPFGVRLHAAREAKGLSQAQVAGKLGITQTAYAVWERHTVALRPEQIEQVAALLDVTAADLMGHVENRKRGGGPVGKAKAVFERVSSLPREQQKRILATVEDMLVAHQTRKAS